MDSTLIGVIITAFVTIGVAIGGFIATNKNLKKSFNDSLKQRRDDVALSKMSEMPYEILCILDAINNDAFAINEYKRVINTIFSYGSVDAIRICVAMQQEAYMSNKNKTDKEKFRGFAFYILLAVQIKYDVTQVLVSPESLYALRLNDYSKNKTLITEINNELVNELLLSTNFIIDNAK